MNFLKMLNSWWVRLGVIVVLVAALYCLVYWGYHSSSLPYQFDEYIQGNGLWQLFGEKTYEPMHMDKWTVAIDPRNTAAVEETLFTATLAGYVREWNVEDGILEDFTLESGTGPSTMFKGPYAVSRVMVHDCLESSGCEKNPYVPGEIDDIKAGFWVQIHMEKMYGEEGWSIAKIVGRNS